jgi:hypothetical protein
MLPSPYAEAMSGPYLLADELKSAAELAGPTRTQERALHRLMRTLSSPGVLTEGTGGRFGLTEMGEALKRGAPGSARASIVTFGGWAWNAFGEMGYSVESGKSSFTKVYGMPPFEWMKGAAGRSRAVCRDDDRLPRG